MRQVGDEVTIRCPRTAQEDENFIKGIITETIARHKSGLPALHVVKGESFRWIGEKWQVYTGVPFLLARERENAMLDYFEFVDVWPRRNPGEV